MAMRTILRRLVLGSTLVVLSAAMGSAPTASESDPGTSEASVAPLPAAPPAANPLVSLTFTGAGPFETTAFVLVVTGIALSLVAAFGLHQAERAVRTADDVTRTMRVPFLGHVPLGPKSHAARRTCFPPPELIPVYQNLRTTLVFTAEERPTRLMGLTSASDREGATLAACDVAVALASGGSRVLLVDAHLSVPSVGDALDLHGRAGLFHVLTGQARIRDAVQRTPLATLSVMTAGRKLAAPAELLTTERMKQLARRLRRGPYDWVVFAAPPVLASDDALLIAPLLDSMAVVMTAQLTRASLADRAVQRLQQARVDVAGVILNGVAAPQRTYARYFQMALGRAS